MDDETNSKLARARKALERAAQDMDTASVALQRARDPTQAQTYATMTDLAAKLVNNAADARNVAALL